MADKEDNTSALQREASKRRTGLAGELGSFLMNNKKWWLLPIIIVMVVLGLLVLLGGTAAAPFIYPLF